MAEEMSQEAMKVLHEEAKKVFHAHKEPVDKTMGKKLIINIASPRNPLQNKTHNPNLPWTFEEIARDIGDAYNAGASIWHTHPIDPNQKGHVTMEQEVQITKEQCDAVFAVAPEIITCRGGLLCSPTFIGPRIIDPKSMQAENSIGPFVDRLVKLGPNNRYIEIGIINAFTDGLGGTYILDFHSRDSVESDVKYLQSKGIIVQLTPYDYSDMQNYGEWIVESGIAKPPFIMDTLLGVHNSPRAKSMMAAYELLFTLRRLMPEGVLWETISAGRYWLPLTVAAISLGADIVRVGFEDSVFMYPHREDYIKSSGKVVEAVAGIAKYLGREVATPREARNILGLPQIKS